MKPSKLNVGLDYLSRIDSSEEGGNMDDNLPDAQLFSIRMVDYHFGDIIQFPSIGVSLAEYTTA